jgi:flagellar biosynthesis/type III secretory pathway ATPase
MEFVADKEHRQAAAHVREILATYEQNRDLIALGAYKSGSDPRIDRAIAKHEGITTFLRQGLHETAPPEETRKRLLALV